MGGKMDLKTKYMGLDLKTQSLLVAADYQKLWMVFKELMILVQVHWS